MSMTLSKQAGADKATPILTGGSNRNSSSSSIDFDDFNTSNSILEFLAKEQECCSDVDADSIFQEVSRLADMDDSDMRSVDEILREAELLIQQQQHYVGGNGGGNFGTHTVIAETLNNNSNNNHVQELRQGIKVNTKYTKRIENVHPHLTAKLLNGPTLTASAKEYIKTITVDAQTTTSLTPTPTDAKQFAAFVDNLTSVSVISEESTPKDMHTLTTAGKEDEDATTAQLNDDDDTDDATDTMEEITEGIETIELTVNEGPTMSGGGGDDVRGKNFNVDNNNANETFTISNNNTNVNRMTMSLSSSSIMPARTMQQQQQLQQSKHDHNAIGRRRTSYNEAMLQHAFASQAPHLLMSSPSRTLNFNTTQECSPSPMERCHSAGVRGSSITTTTTATTLDGGVCIDNTQQSTAKNSSHTYSPLKTTAVAAKASASTKTYCNRSVNSSPKRMISAVTSPIEPLAAMTREHVLKQEIEQLQEKLKDTEERLQSLRIQHDSLSQLHRDLRESNTHLQEESEMLKLDVQHLNECANILRSELQSARTDRNEAVEMQKILQAELEESRQDKKRTQEQKDKDTKVIQDLQRQCREMERILMRKHPDSVSALIVASKNPGKYSNNDQENSNSRKLLEQRIAQLEADAKEQDFKAQQILANVQARFNSVQSKYETHIADLETQVLSLQEINTKLNEKIESQVRTLDYFVTKKAERYYNNCTQTDALEERQAADGGTSVETVTATTSTQTTAKTATTRDHSTNTIGATPSQQQSANSSASSTANSTPNTSRPSSKQSGLRKPIASASGSLLTALTSKLPVSQSDSTISMSAYHAAAKEDAHLLATIRGMRVDLALKDKAMQRLSRELDECKKTIKKLQKEKDVLKPNSGIGSIARRTFDINHHNDQTPANTESQALKEAQNKIKLLEADYKSLHDKRLQDLKTLQTAHERELASCHETVRILQQRLNERDEAFANQKRRKVPVDYYALKAKVSSLERRHSEREERLHMLVEALSKGRLNGALEDLLSENNNP